ncbi:uncharacterized protein LOC141805429 isoform X1 [Halichoeres trimaculatus]|uniref:uncharacterized protein LOC141805429 isoform X1 n=1 Tax=Halichoeres trimaculatus TaxID=147232 RepID=UPI003D9EF79E
MSVRELLLNLLEDLVKEEDKKLRFFLNDSATLDPCIPKGKLEGAGTTDIVDIIIKTYHHQAIEVVMKILKKIPRNDLAEKLQKKMPKNRKEDKCLKEISRKEEVDKLQKKISKGEEVEGLSVKISRGDEEVEDQQHHQSTSSSTVALGLDVLEQKKRSPSVEVSSEVQVLTGALFVCIPDENSSLEEVSVSPPVVKASSFTQTTNTSSKYDHITCKDLIQSGPPAVYQLIPKKQNIGKGIRKISLGKRDPKRTNKTILLVGETGAGKSTLLNALVNYDIGVEWEDDIWFEIIETEEKKRKCEEQEPDVIVYEIFGFKGKTLPYSLTIIDTPGYGDTRGTEHDETISRRLSELFNTEDGVCRINLVGLVLKASENRLNDRLRYVFDSVVSLFGKDLEDNIVALITYSFGRAPINVLEALEAANIKCAKNERNRPVHFMFDKCPNTERMMDSKVTWDIMKEGMREFTDYLKESEPKKLKTTAEVLNTRIQLTACVQNLQERIQETEVKQTEIQQRLEKAKQEMKNNENFIVEVDEDSSEREDISGGTWGLMLLYDGAVCCLHCKETCHYPCTMAWSPYSCNIMLDEKCTVCKGNCHVSKHVKEQWKYVTKTQKVMVEDQDMKRRYEEGRADHDSLQKELKKIKEELNGYKDQLLEEAFQYVLRLEQIALNTNSLSTHIHLEFLMEKMNERGHTSKVQKLEEMRSRVNEGIRAGLRYKLTAASKKVRPKVR